jgi:hypothetical protein
MVNWANVLKASTNQNIVEGVRIIAGEAKKGFVEGVRTIADETKQGIEENRKKRQIADRKRQIVDRMYPGVIKKLALDRGIHPDTLGYPTIDDNREAVVVKVSLNDLIDFAVRKRIFIRDIQDEINKEVSKQEEQKLAKEDSIGETYRKVFSSVNEFKPLKNYHHEYSYQSELAQWMKSRFPDTNIEIQRGSSRPDVVVSGIAIEIKGPTGIKELRTIADKCMRYSQHFKSGIIIVLFDVQVNTHWYA